MQRQDGTAGKLLRGAFAGVVAGVTASFAMDLFQAATSAMSSSSGEEASEPATEKTADRIAEALTGSELAPADKTIAGQGVHYAFGIALGLAYGIAAEFRPTVTAGYGTAFGVGSATLFDEGFVPAAGLGEVPWKAGLTGNLYAYASHLVFGVTSELIRRQVVRSLEP